MDVIRVKYKVVEGVLPNACFLNVEAVVRNYGGQPVFGWRVDSYGIPVVSLLHHCIWRDEQGNLWDISPSINSTEYDEIGELVIPTEIDFIIDPTAKPLGQVGSRTVLPTKYVATTDNAKVVKACGFLERSEEAVAVGDWDRARYYDKKANDLLHKFGHHVNSAPDILVISSSWSEQCN